MTVDFARDRVGGSVTNINLVDPDGRPDQRLDGSLGIDGSENSGRIDSFASGTVTAVDDTGFLRDSDILLFLDGDVRDDLSLEIDGVFFGTSN